MFTTLPLGSCAPGWGAWKLFDSSIVKGTDNILRASVEAGVSRFLHVSSGTVHGKLCEGDTPVCESTVCDVPFCRDSYYDFAKLQAENVANNYHKEGKIQVSMIRIGAIYGPRDRLLAERLYRHLSMPIIVWPGQSNPKYSIVYVTDAADLAIIAANSDRAQGGVYNVAPLYEVPLRTFAAALLKAMGKPKPHVDMPYCSGLHLVHANGGMVKAAACSGNALPYTIQPALHQQRCIP